MANNEKERQAGKGVDSQGRPVIDPTENVIALTKAESKRQDDLREAENKLTAEKISNLSKIVELRAEHEKEMSTLESNRLNAIRQVDVLAVSTAADRAAAAISALAATTAANAENLRNALTTTATTIATQTANTVLAITERISALEKSSYEGKGKQAVSDPQLAEMLLEMKSLRESRASVTGKSEGISISWGLILTILATIAAFAIVWVTNKPSAPQTIYMPAPAQTSPNSFLNH